MHSDCYHCKQSQHERYRMSFADNYTTDDNKRQLQFNVGRQLPSMTHDGVLHAPHTLARSKYLQYFRLSE